MFIVVFNMVLKGVHFLYGPCMPTIINNCFLGRIVAVAEKKKDKKKKDKSGLSIKGTSQASPTNVIPGVFSSNLLGIVTSKIKKATGK